MSAFVDPIELDTQVLQIVHGSGESPSPWLASSGKDDAFEFGSG